MKTELKEVSPTQKELKIEIDAARKGAYGKVSQKYAKGASVPGFRKGYAPLDVVRLRFKDEIKGDVLQEVIPAKVAEAIQQHELHPLDRAASASRRSRERSRQRFGAVSLHVHVEVMPEIPAPKYDGIEVTRRSKPVEDAEVEELIAEPSEGRGRTDTRRGPQVRDRRHGDRGPSKARLTTIRTPSRSPPTTRDRARRRGHRKIIYRKSCRRSEDEEKEFTVVYPADFTSEALAGKTVHYKAKIKSVGRTEVPELNDDWAKSLDEGYESLADLRKKLRADLESCGGRRRRAVRNNAIAKLIEENTFEVPQDADRKPGPQPAEQFRTGPAAAGRRPQNSSERICPDGVRAI